MASAAGPRLYWCHQCNSQTIPTSGDDILCSFCNQGFIEELENTEVEPGVAFSTLPVPLGNFLRRPSPGSVGISRDRSMTDAAPPSPLSSQSLTTSSSSSSQVRLPGQQQSEPQGHPPRILSSQVSGVPSLLEAMMLALEEFSGSPAQTDSDNTSDRSVREDAGTHVTRQDSTRSSNRGSGLWSGSQEDGPAFMFPPPAPMLILHGGMPTGLRTLEVFIDNGEGLGPQMMPSHFSDYFLGSDLDRLIQVLAENDPNRYGTPPAAKSAVEKLPKFKIAEEHLQANIEQCAVCKEDFELDGEVQQMPCRHVYHCECILPWLEQHNSCPVCRYELPTDDPDYEARKSQGPSGLTNTNPSEDDRVRNPDSSDRQGDVNNANQGSPHMSRQFTLWGMPSIGMDLSRLVMLGNDIPRLTGTSGGPNVLPQDEGAVNEVEGADRDGLRGNVPVQWLFRLFSSGGRENGGNSEASSELERARDSSAQ